jgi:hypothetical protein
MAMNPLLDTKKDVNFDRHAKFEIVSAFDPITTEFDDERVPVVSAPVYALLDLSRHALTLLPESVIVLLSAASSQSARPGRSCGLKLAVCEESPTTDIFAYKSRIVLEVSRETTSVCVLLLGMMRGLVRFSVFVRVIVSCEAVEFRSDQ